MARQTNDDSQLPQRDAGGGRRAPGPTITGRSFARARMASDRRREQAAALRGERWDGSRADERLNGRD
jgi:hypothetical protein